MKPQQFRELLRERIPTAEEFLAFVQAQGWQVVRRADGSPALRAPKGGDLARGLASLLAREPYRTNVLAVVFQDSPEAKMGMMPLPETPVAPPLPARQWLWRDGHRYTEAPDDVTYHREDWHPVGAWWWRWPGEAWRAVPERPGVGLEPPEGVA